MTGRTPIATAHWRRMDIEGTDRCTLSRLDHGWMLVGQAIWHDDGIDSDLAYDVRCDLDWNSLSADVCGEVAGHELAVRLRREPKGWLLNGTLQENTGGCLDLDLSFTPATNTLPLRRLSLDRGENAVICAAWLMPDFGTVMHLEQTYSRLRDGTVRYLSGDFETDLQVHMSGFVTRYPGLWDGWVDD